MRRRGRSGVLALQALCWTDLLGPDSHQQSPLRKGFRQPPLSFPPPLSHDGLSLSPPPSVDGCTTVETY